MSNQSNAQQGQRQGQGQGDWLWQSKELVLDIARAQEKDYAPEINQIASNISQVVGERMRGLISSGIISPITSAVVSASLSHVIDKTGLEKAALFYLNDPDTVKLVEQERAEGEREKREEKAKQEEAKIKEQQNQQQSREDYSGLTIDQAEETGSVDKDSKNLQKAQTNLDQAAKEIAEDEKDKTNKARNKSTSKESSNISKNKANQKELISIMNIKTN